MSLFPFTHFNQMYKGVVRRGLLMVIFGPCGYSLLWDDCYEGKEQ